ncbi:MAG TPA: hypothetical protein VJ860_24395 [Polyangia bacterium]|jgi:hypothetical protein|nr:hypothetical protein [Polyangia bacterium]
MGKRLSANAPKPRTRFPFPGYPTVAAAGLYLCLSGGCSPGPGFTDTTNAGGARNGGTTGAGGATSTGGSTGITDTTNTGGYLAGGVSPIYDDYPPPEPDAGAPDVLPPAPDAVPDVMEPPATEDASEADLVPSETPLPPFGGAAPIPY